MGFFYDPVCACISKERWGFIWWSFVHDSPFFSLTTGNIMALLTSWIFVHIICSFWLLQSPSREVDRSISGWVRCMITSVILCVGEFKLTIRRNVYLQSSARILVQGENSCLFFFFFVFRLYFTFPVIIFFSSHVRHIFIGTHPITLAILHVCHMDGFVFVCRIIWYQNILTGVVGYKFR